MVEFRFNCYTRGDIYPVTCSSLARAIILRGSCGSIKNPIYAIFEDKATIAAHSL